MKKERVKITTTVNEDIKKEFEKLNMISGNNLTWADCVRRGFHSFRAEIIGMEVGDILNMRGVVPIQVIERIRLLSNKVSEVSQELELLRKQAGMLPLEGVKDGSKSS